MKKLLILALCAASFACGGKKEKETPVSDPTETPVNKDTGSATPTPPPAKPDAATQTTTGQLVLDGVEYAGNVGQAVFQQNGKTLFYYNVDKKKGLISINGEQYTFDFFKHTINEPDFTLKAGDQLTVKVEGTAYSEYENPEPGIQKGKAATVTITLGTETLTLKNIEVIDGTNAD